MPVPVYVFAAYSDVGKTSYLEKLIPLLRSAGLRIGVIKHDVHGIQLDTAGKDTWRFTKAGADVVSVASKSGYALFAQEPVSLDELIRQLSHVDMILVEGYKSAPYPKIALFRSASGKSLAVDPRACFAIITDEQMDVPCPTFPLDDPRAFAEYLISGRFNSPPQLF